MKKNIEDRANTPCYTETHGGEVKENKARDYGGFQGLLEALAQSCGIDPSDEEGWVYRDNKRTTTEICEDNKRIITDTREELENYDKQIVCNASTLSKVEDLKERVSERKERIITAMRDPDKTELLSKCDRLMERLNAKAERLRATPESKNVIISLPEEFKTEIAKKILARGVEAGYFEQRGEGFKYKISKEELAWFAYKFNIRVLGKSRGKRGKEVKRNQFNWDIFHKAFGVDKLGQEYNKIKQYDEMKANIKFQNITKLFD